MPTTHDNNARTTLVPPPPDATQTHGWLQQGIELQTRAFDGTVREAAGFTVRVQGIQRQNGTCRRWLTVEAQARGSADGARSGPAAGCALSAAAYEIETRR
jgi:hypothetical protein